MHPALRIESLWMCHAAGVRGCSARVWSLRGLTITVQPEERVAIIGAAGSGKTTLAECILGVRKPTAGTIEIGGPLEIVDLRSAGATSAPTGTRSGGLIPASRPSDLPPATLVLARRSDALGSWADRVLELRDGRLWAKCSRAALRVAERTTLQPDGARALR